MEEFRHYVNAVALKDIFCFFLRHPFQVFTGDDKHTCHFIIICTYFIICITVQEKTFFFPNEFSFTGGEGFKDEEEEESPARPESPKIK